MILLNKSHFSLDTTEHYATIWSIYVLHGSALT